MLNGDDCVPKENIWRSVCSCSSPNSLRYSVFAGSMTKKGVFISQAALSNTRQVLVFPPPVIPEMKVCLARESVSIFTGRFLIFSPR